MVFFGDHFTSGETMHGLGHERLEMFRATASIPLNICEGAGERAEGRKAYSYRISQASATELAGAPDHMVDMDMLTEADCKVAMTLIARIVAMLFKLTNSVTTPDSYPPLPKRRSANTPRPHTRRRLP